MNMRQRVMKIARDHDIKHIAEVGVWSGTLSTRIATLPGLEELILIDPWSADLNSFEEDGELYECRMSSPETITQEQCDTVFDNVVTMFADNPNVTILRMTSEEASKVIADGYLDMVFIDAIHLYEHTKQDIELWLPKLRKGGIISGDDYAPRFDGVQRAVDEFGGCTVQGVVWWKQV